MKNLTDDFSLNYIAYFLLKTHIRIMGGVLSTPICSSPQPVVSFNYMIQHPSTIIHLLSTIFSNLFLFLSLRIQFRNRIFSHYAGRMLNDNHRFQWGELLSTFCFRLSGLSPTPSNLSSLYQDSLTCQLRKSIPSPLTNGSLSDLR